MKQRSMAVAVLVGAMMVVSLCVAVAEDNPFNSDGFEIALDGSRMASTATLPELAASYGETLPAAPERGKGGCMAGLMSTACIAVPAGQVHNSGYEVPMEKALLRLIVVGALIDGYNAYRGETAEQYIGAHDITYAEKERKGFDSGARTCLTACFGGIPGGHVMNSGYNIPARAYGLHIPYVNIAVLAYDSYKAYEGENIAEYLGQ